jgi:hypothetical protein
MLVVAVEAGDEDVVVAVVMEIVPIVLIAETVQNVQIVQNVQNVANSEVVAVDEVESLVESFGEVVGAVVAAVRVVQCLSMTRRHSPASAASKRRKPTPQVYPKRNAD